jgi:hypothetical protein
MRLAHKSLIRNCLIILLMVGTACIHMPGSNHRFTEHPNDGLSVLTRLDADDALETATNALISQGFTIATERSKKDNAYTMPYKIGGDSTMVVNANVILIDKSTPRSVITFSATYSSPSQRVNNKQVVKSQNSGDPLWNKLSAVFDVIAKPKK